MALQPEFIRSLSGISAASGLVKLGQMFFSVADDRLDLVSFTEDPAAEIALKPLFPGTLPKDFLERKKLKPDLEALVYLQDSDFFESGALLALPSGSKPNRMRGALVVFEQQLKMRQPREIDFSGLFSSLLEKIPDLNIEGAVVTDQAVKLLQRGNSRRLQNAIITLDRTAFYEDVSQGTVSEDSLLAITNVELGRLEGVPLSFTDGALLGDGRIFFSGSCGKDRIHLSRRRVRRVGSRMYQCE